MKLNQIILATLCPVVLAAAACSHSGTKPESAQQMSVKDTSNRVADATQVIRTMEADPKMKPVLQKARGIFIIPHYKQGALGLGFKGGEGIVLMKNGTSWSDPAFYNFGGLTAGFQIGGEGGALAFILNNDKAVEQFKQNNNFSLSADAGLTIANWSKMTAAELSRADMVVWSDTRGFFGGAAIGLQNIRFDEVDTQAFFEKSVQVNEILAGKLKAPHEKTNSIKQSLMATQIMIDDNSPINY